MPYASDVQILPFLLNLHLYSSGGVSAALLSFLVVAFVIDWNLLRGSITIHFTLVIFIREMWLTVGSWKLG